MDRVVCWNSAEKTYNHFPHHCFVWQLKEGVTPMRDRFLKNRWHRVIFWKIGTLLLNDVIFFLTVVETYQMDFKLSNTPNGQSLMWESCWKYVQYVKSIKFTNVPNRVDTPCIPTEFFLVKVLCFLKIFQSAFKLSKCPVGAPITNWWKFWSFLPNSGGGCGSVGWLFHIHFPVTIPTYFGIS